jgi:hypothetical protein
MKSVSSLADRILSMFVPSVTASARIPCPASYQAECSACRTTTGGKIQSVKTCSYVGGNCTLKCGACYTIVGCL